MDEVPQAKAPEELHRELRIERLEKETAAEIDMAEVSEEISTEASVRAGVAIEEADRWSGVDTSDEAIHEIITRGVAEIIVREELQKKLKSGRKLRIKLGIDPTGPLLRWAERADLQAAPVSGDGTPGGPYHRGLYGAGWRCI